jgi:hypothetical protein
MSPIRQAPYTTSCRPLSDGAELPLLDPRLLATLTTSVEQRRTQTTAGQCLLLSEGDLGEFDPRRVFELRAALVGLSAPVRPVPLVHSHGRRPVPLQTLVTQLVRRGAIAGATFALAFGLGIVAGFIT